MSGATHNQLELHLRGFLSTHCEVVRDGVAVATTSTLYSPLRTRFPLADGTWETHLHIPGGRGIDTLREVLAGGLLGRGAFALHDPNGAVVATARERGFFRGGYDLLVHGGQPAQLLTDSKASRWDYQGPGGSGRCLHYPAHRQVRAALPCVLPLPQQLFVVLLALRSWVNFSSSE